MTNTNECFEDAGDIVRMDLGGERFCRSPERDNLAFCSSTLAVRAGHRTADQPLDGYAGRETAAPEIPAKSTPAISMASPLSTFTPASSRTLHSSSGCPTRNHDCPRPRPSEFSRRREYRRQVPLLRREARIRWDRRKAAVRQRCGKSRQTLRATHREDISALARQSRPAGITLI